ncbi:MAG: phosphate acyltransferase PlsX [Lachnospiraceae bacterium]|nr:phosphate acyltransferase PlsX [Lachnospiraceae bacterium]
MSERLCRIAFDGMGGDDAPSVTVAGAVAAVRDDKGIEIHITGIEEKLREELSKHEYDRDRIIVVPASEVIETAEPPVVAVHNKKDSSLVKALYMVKRGECDAYLSAGSTGATLVGGQIIVGRIAGVERPALAPVIPTEKGVSVLIDCGANVDARASQLVQFARMGSAYSENVLGVKDPTVALVNIGAEEEKGNSLVKETYPLLKECRDINFIGNIEARDISAGAADVIVCEAFTGNVILKMYEGVASTFYRLLKSALMKNTVSKLGALIVKPYIKDGIKDFTMSKYGAAPLLGCRGLVMKTHGSCDVTEVRNSLIQCREFVESGITERFEKLFGDKSED